MANVFDNSMTAHAWAHGNGEARSHNGNLFADGRILYSYGRHFPVGVRIAPDFFVMNADSYSISTSRHQMEARRAVHGRVASVPDLEKVATLLSQAADGDAPHNAAARLVQFFERAEMANACELDTMQALFDLVGSRANPYAVNRRAIKAREKKAADAEKKRQAAALDLARKCLAHPLATFTYRNGEARAPLAPYSRYNIETLPTEMARAWKVAKAKGWSAESLRKLRQRENLVREGLKREEKRQQALPRRRRAREALATLRQLRGSRSVADAFAHGSTQLRAAIGEAMFSLYANAPTPLAFSWDAWSRGARELRDGARKAREVAHTIRNAKRQQEAFEELTRWRAGDTSARFPAEYSRRDSQEVRAVNVERDSSGDIVGGTLETSGYARVPLVEAIRVFKFLKLCVWKAHKEGLEPDSVIWRANGSRVRVGPFSLDYVKASGDFKAGCHFIKYADAHALAIRLGVFDAQASDEVVTHGHAFA
jgi:hypothetical protein